MRGCVPILWTWTSAGHHRCERWSARSRSSETAAAPTLLQVAAVDTNGAGDTFATMYMLALARGDRDPGAVASLAASRAVMQPQTCKPDCAPALFAGIIRPLSLWDRVSNALLRLLDAVPQRPKEVAQQLLPASLVQAVQQLGWRGPHSEQQ